MLQSMVFWMACKGDPGPAGSPDAAPDRSPEPDPWMPAPVDLADFARGVQVGEVTSSTAIVSLRTELPVVSLQLMEAQNDAWVSVQRMDELKTSDGGLQMTLDGLKADTAYAVAFQLPDVTSWSPSARFRTAVDDNGWRKLELGVTSCFAPNANEFANVGFVAATDPDALILLGDSVYADNAIVDSDYRAYWDAFLQTPGTQTMFAHTSVVATWDDHEVANNWTLLEPVGRQTQITLEQLDVARTDFRRYIPQGVGPDGDSIWRKVSYGHLLDVFVLDSRGERNWDDKIVSDEQLQWVIDGLHASTAVFKLVMASVHVTDHTAILGTLEAEDRWQGYPSQRGPLVEALAEVPGAFVVSGDLHYGAVQLLDPPGGVGEHVAEVAAGPVGSELFPISAVVEAADHPPQYMLTVDGFNSTRLVLDPGLETVEVTFLDDLGAVSGEMTLDLSR